MQYSAGSNPWCIVVLTDTMYGRHQTFPLKGTDLEIWQPHGLRGEVVFLLLFGYVH